MLHIRFDNKLGGEYMKLLVAGSRSIKEYDLQGLVPEGVTLIITGGASGIDEIAEEYAFNYKNILSLLELNESSLTLRHAYDELSTVE